MTSACHDLAPWPSSKFDVFNHSTGTRLVSMVGMPWLVHGAMSGGNKHLTEIWCRASQSSDQGPTGFTAVMSA